MENENSWALSVEKVNNGYIVRTANGAVIVHQEHHLEAIYDNSEDQNDLTAMKNVLLEILSFFDLQHNKHSKQNIKISIEENFKRPE